MLLSPLASPSKYTSSLCLSSLPPIQHHHISHNEDEDEDDEDSLSSSSSASDTDSASDESILDDAEIDVGIDAGVDDGDRHRSQHIVSLQAEPQTVINYQLELPLSPEIVPEPEPEPLALPVELVYDVVELAASHRRTAITLCRVASWVRSAVLPILYGTLVLHGNGPTPLGAIIDKDEDGGEARCRTATLESPLRHIRSLWLDVPPERAPRSLDACLRLRQLALPLEAHATICNTTRWLAHDPRARPSVIVTKEDSDVNCNVLELDVHGDGDGDGDDVEVDVEPCRSFTVLGQSHPHRWAPLTSSPNGRAFLRGVTHLRILNLCLSHYIPLEYTPNLTHLCIPFFDLRISPSSLNSFSISSPIGSAATTSFTGLDYILAQPSLRMVVLTLNPRYWRFDELSLKEWAVRAMARDPRLYVVAATRDDATRDWDVPRRDWEDEAGGGMSVWDKAVCVRRKFLTRLSRTWESYLS